MRTRLLPRFGLLSLCAAMLLFVSAAGWIESYIDLRQEEDALLADLAKAGIDVVFARSNEDLTVPESEREAAWATHTLFRELRPYAFRINQLVLNEDAPAELRNRAARLPYLELFQCSDGSPPPKMAVESIAASLGFALDQLPEPKLSSPDEALLKGETLDEASAAAELRRIREAWKAPSPAPICGRVHSIRAIDGWGSVEQVRALDDSSILLIEEGALFTATRQSNDGYRVDTDSVRQILRNSRRDLLEEAFRHESASLVAFDPRKELASSLEAYGIAEQVDAAIESASPNRVRRVDERRVRVDLEEFRVQYPAVGYADTFQVSLVLRSDLEGALESWEIEGQGVLLPSSQQPSEGDGSDAGETGPPASLELTSASLRQAADLTPLSVADIRDYCRCELRRENGATVASSWAVERLIGYGRRPSSGLPSFPASERTAGVAEYDFSGDLDLTRITSEALDAETFPPQRPLPWLPWHRVTFVASLAPFASLGVRRFLSMLASTNQRLNDEQRDEIRRDLEPKE